jgi:hypothetical protein
MRRLPGVTLRQRARWSQVPQTGASPALLSSLLLTGLDHLEQHALTPGTQPVLKVEQPTDHDDVQRQDRQKTSRQIANQLLNHRTQTMFEMVISGLAVWIVIAVFLALVSR